MTQAISLRHHLYRQERWPNHLSVLSIPFPAFLYPFRPHQSPRGGIASESIENNSESMKLLAVLVLQLLSIFGIASFRPTFAFVPAIKSVRRHSVTTTNMATLQPGINICDLPGDPSLILTTNVDLGDKKLEIMKGRCLPSAHWRAY